MKFKKFANAKPRPAILVSFFFIVIAIYAQSSSAPIDDNDKIAKLERNGWIKNPEEINCDSRITQGFFEWTQDGFTRELYRSPSGVWISPQIIEASEESPAGNDCRIIPYPSLVKEV